MIIGLRCKDLVMMGKDMRREKAMTQAVVVENLINLDRWKRRVKLGWKVLTNMKL